MTEFDAERVALYVAGALPPDEVHSFECGFADAESSDLRSVRDFDSVVRGFASDDVAPPPRIRAALLAAIDPRSADRAAAARVSGMAFLFAEDANFEPTPYPGITMRVLNTDLERQQFTCLIRLEPGSTFPSHPHDGPEECIVLDGEFAVFGVTMKKGDYQRAAPGRDHGVQSSATGALVYLSGPLSLLRT